MPLAFGDLSVSCPAFSTHLLPRAVPPNSYDRLDSISVTCGCSLFQAPRLNQVLNSRLPLQVLAVEWDSSSLADPLARGITILPTLNNRTCQWAAKLFTRAAWLSFWMKLLFLPCQGAMSGVGLGFLLAHPSFSLLSCSGATLVIFPVSPSFSIVCFHSL